MTTLITGGASQTGLALASLLHASGRKVIFASRSGSRIPDVFSPHITLDWKDLKTVTDLWNSPQASEIKYVYLLPPNNFDGPEVHNEGDAIVKTFIDLGNKAGVERFVLLAGSADVMNRGPNAHGVGKIHSYLHDKGLDYVALRPTWFMENFLRFFSQGIKESNTLKSILPTGKVAFIAVQDIAQAAFDAITNVDSLPNREPGIVGPELLSYDEVAELFTEVLGRKIVHEVITEQEKVESYVAGVGLPPHHAQVLVEAEKTVENGSEERFVARGGNVVGKVKFRDWIVGHKAAFL